jgi:anti-sigma B factor antagonist
VREGESVSNTSKKLLLNISERQKDDVSILDLEGNVIMGGGSALLREEIRRLVGQGKNRILLNFREVKYLDSSGIGELMASLVSLNRQGGQLGFCNLTERVTEVMELSSLISIFEIFDSEDAALKGFEEP